MTWKSHVAIAAAVTIPFNPALLPAAALGATAPDWSEWVLKFFGIRVTHRGATHYLIVPLGIIAISFIIDFQNIIFWFGIGYLTHWIADSMTISGVPLSPYDRNKIHLFGGKLRTGDMTEYIISFSLLAVVLLIFNPTKAYLTADEKKPIKYNPYFIDYNDLYDRQIIDERSFLEKRFKLF
jgi:inner membrane protein